MLNSVCIFQDFLSPLPIHSPTSTENPMSSKIRVFETQGASVTISTALWNRNREWTTPQQLCDFRQITKPLCAQFPSLEDEANDPSS